MDLHPHKALPICSHIQPLSSPNYSQPGKKNCSFNRDWCPVKRRFRMALWMLVFSISSICTFKLQRVEIKGWKWPATISPHALCWATVISTGAPLRIVPVKAFCEEVSFERGWCWMAALGIKDLCWTKDSFIDADGASCCVELTWLLVARWALFLGEERGVWLIYLFIYLVIYKQHNFYNNFKWSQLSWYSAISHRH